MTGIFARLNTAALQQIGRQPEWYTIDDPTGPPETANDGVNLGNTPTALVAVRLRETIAYRTARITVGADGSTVYEVTIDGTTVSYDASTGSIPVGAEETIISDLADAINNDGTASSVVTAYAVDADGDGDADTVRIEGDTEADYTISTGISVGSGTIDHTADATTANIEIYAYPRGIGDVPAGWTLVNDAIVDGLDYRGFLERFSVAGLGRLYVEVSGADGQLTAAVGPAIAEDG